MAVAAAKCRFSLWTKWTKNGVGSSPATRPHRPLKGSSDCGLYFILQIGLDSRLVEGTGRALPAWQIRMNREKSCQTRLYVLVRKVVDISAWPVSFLASRRACISYCRCGSVCGSPILSLSPGSTGSVHNRDVACWLHGNPRRLAIEPSCWPRYSIRLQIRIRFNISTAVYSIRQRSLVRD